MTARHIVVMAGGAGTRFWPASRSRRPKQFLAIGGDQPLLRATVERVQDLVEPQGLWVVTAAHHADHVRAQLPELPETNLLIEPAPRNTSACIALAAETIRRTAPDARIAVLPADHHIGDVVGFRAYLDAAFDAASEHIVLFGIVPDRAETGYGYIQQGPRAAGTDERPVHAVARFVEKPDATTAQRYLQEGGYLWNAGIFVFAAARMMEEIDAFLPELGVGVRACVDDPQRLEEIYPTLPSISIDYGVMERSTRTWVIPSRFEWSDVGSWDSAMAIQTSDEDGNVVIGDATLIDVNDSFVRADAGRAVAVVGLSDVVVVDTPDALLVVRREASQSVKRVVEALRQKGRDDLL